MSYKLGKRSRGRLQGVHPDLVRVVERAIEITEVDFTVTEGLRTLTRQRKLFKAGSSWIRPEKGRHVTGHAVDLGAWVDGRVDWSWSLYYKIAEAVQQAARELGVSIKWGGAWDRSLTATNKDPERLSAAYVAARHRLGKKARPDGPHFELSRKDYPA